MFRCSASRALLALISFLPLPAGAADEVIRGFVSVEPFEIRLEALVRVEPFRESWRMEGDAIGPGEKQAVLDNLLTLFESGVEVKVPGTPIVYSSRTVRFVTFDAEKGYVPDERQNIPLTEALVGLTLSSTATGISEMEVEWLWFAPGQERLVVEIASRGKPSARVLTPAVKKAAWKLNEEIALPTLQVIPGLQRVERRPLRHLIFAGIAMLIYAGVVVIQRKTKSPAWVGWLIVGGVAVGFLALKVRTDEVILPENAAVEDIVYSLLRNTYHAFDFRDESAIYDTLESSVSGPLLEKVYLEMRESLELESTGGPRVRVYEIALRQCEDLKDGSLSGGEFKTRAEWVTIGEVTNWGHTHERTNKYEAAMTVSAVDDTWKISALDLLNEERIQKMSRRVVAPES